MQNTLFEMWKKYNLLLLFKNEMNKLGYASRDLYPIEKQMDILKEFIELESENVLSLLLRKTYYRLLKNINKGIEYLPEIVESPENWILNPIEKDIDAWIDSDVMIFTTKSKVAVFSKLSRKDSGSHYIDGKWQ